MDENYTNTIQQMAEQRQRGLLEAPAPLQAAVNRAEGIEQIAGSVLAKERADVQRSRQNKRAFADGGKIDAEALLAQMKNKYGVGNSSTPAAAPAPAPAPVQQRAAAPASPSIQGAASALRKHADQLKEAASYNRGGKIKGPGTATSDSIPAKVKETGEDIRVANGERILSVKQDQLLQRIAKERGFDTVDAMLEHGTGEPVGPTIKAGKKAAAGGMSPGFEDDKGYHPASLASSNPAPIQPPTTPGERIMINGIPHIETGPQERNPLTHMANAAAGTMAFLNPVERGIEARREANRADLVSDGGQSPSQQIAANPPAAGPAPQAVASKTVPAEPAPSPILAPSAATLTTKDIVPGGYTDRGAGIIGSRDAKGQLNVTNAGTEGVAERSSPIIDGSASALIDQKNSTYNPARQLANMQRLRMMGDATDSSITDPEAQAGARSALTAMNQTTQTEAQNTLQSAQARQATITADQMAQMESMRAQLLDPRTPPEDRDRMVKTMQAIMGTVQRPFQVHDVEQPIDPANPLLGNRKTPYRFDPIMGTLEPLNRPGEQSGDAIAQAKAAIARGANKAAVNARLKSLGLPEIQ